MYASLWGAEVISIRYDTIVRLPAARQLAFFPILTLWAALTAVFIVVAHFSGYGFPSGGRSFTATLLSFALLLAVMLLFAARGSTEKFSSTAGPGSAWLLALILFFAFLVYALGTSAASLTRLAAAAAFIFLPLLLLAAARSSSSGSWQDLLTIVALWTAVKFGPSHWLWPYPGGRLAYIFTVLLAINIAIAGFLLLRRTKNVGYNIGWAHGWTLSTL